MLLDRRLEVADLEDALLGGEAEAAKQDERSGGDEDETYEAEGAHATNVRAVPGQAKGHATALRRRPGASAAGGPWSDARWRASRYCVLVALTPPPRLARDEHLTPPGL